MIAYGRSVLDALAAADELEAEGISLEVVDLRSLVPLDVATILDSVRKTRRAVVAHLAVEFCGPGAEIASIISNRLFGELEAPVERLGGQYSPIPSSRTLELRGIRTRRPSALRLVGRWASEGAHDESTSFRSGSPSWP